MEVINIRDYVKKDSKVLSDRPRGEKVREQLKLDVKDKDNNQYIFKFDDNFISLNSSFWLGLFEDSFRNISIDEFEDKYTFECKDTFRKKINECIKVVKLKREAI